MSIFFVKCGTNKNLKSILSHTIPASAKDFFFKDKIAPSFFSSTLSVRSESEIQSDL